MCSMLSLLNNILSYNGGFNSDWDINMKNGPSWDITCQLQCAQNVENGQLVHV